MTVGPDISGLSHAQKDALIGSLMAQVAALVARVAELEAKLGLPPKTPDNSSLPPSKGQKPSAPAAPKAKAKAHAGAHRPLHPDPTSKRDFRALRCQGCGADVSGVAQSPCESYDRVEIPEIEPDVTRVTLHGGVCPCCAKRFKAEPPQGLEPGSPFGPNLRAAIYLRSVQGIRWRG
jgi:transposase